MAQQISYKGFCALGGLNNPKLYTRAVYLNGWYMHTTYWCTE